MPDTTLRVVAKIVSKSECIEELKAVLLTLIEPTRVEAGCISYEMLQNNDDPADFTFIESWESMVHLEAHLQTDHFKAAADRFADLTATAPDISTYSVVA